ncbi:hypothetical protein TNCV_4684131 [Trichonephila clavipes]|nr:hypothetical protein TNCV_4684131 [Trichonephila clavipes]
MIIIPKDEKNQSVNPVDPLAFAERQEVNKRIEEVAQLEGIIRPSSSEYAKSNRNGRLQLPSQRVRHALLAKDLVTWRAMGRTSPSLKTLLGGVAQYVDEHYPVDKWHLGDLMAWVAQSALKYRPRICRAVKVP